MNLHLRPFRPDDETAARAAHAELEREGFPFLLGWEPEEPWAAYVECLRRRRRGYAGEILRQSLVLARAEASSGCW